MCAEPPSWGLGFVRMKKPWKPRCSSLGSYMSCLLRAANDRMAYEGQREAPPEQADTSAASLGTCIHFTLQDGLRCKFPAKKLPIDPVNFLFRVEDLERAGQPLNTTTLTDVELELLTLADEHFEGDLSAAHAALAVGDSRCYQPTKGEWEDAAGLFGGDLARTRESVRGSASLGAGKVPALPGGVWHAEDELENEYTIGHTDFLRSDRKVLGDLKTTQKPPTGGWMKTYHLPQLTAYHLLTEAERAWVLYLDSIKGRWVNLVWIDFTTDAMKYYADQVRSFCEFLMSDKLIDVCFPNIGDHCKNSFCRYKAECFSKIMPPPGSLYNLSLSRKQVGPIRLTPL